MYFIYFLLHAATELYYDMMSKIHELWNAGTTEISERCPLLRNIMVSTNYQQPSMRAVVEILLRTLSPW
jgi:hypothetical protein